MASVTLQRGQGSDTESGPNDDAAHAGKLVDRAGLAEPAKHARGFDAVHLTGCTANVTAVVLLIQQWVQVDGVQPGLDGMGAGSSKQLHCRCLYLC